MDAEKTNDSDAKPADSAEPPEPSEPSEPPLPAYLRQRLTDIAADEQAPVSHWGKRVMLLGIGLVSCWVILILNSWLLTKFDDKIPSVGWLPGLPAAGVVVWYIGSVMNRREQD